MARPDLPDLPDATVPPGARVLAATAARIRAAADEIGFEYQPLGAPRFDAGRVEIIWRQ